MVRRRRREALVARAEAIDTTDEVVGRLRKRAELEGRTDDNEETIRERMRVYDAETAPLLDYYRERSLLTEISGMGAVEEVSARISEALG